MAVIAIGFFIWLTNSYVLKSNADQKKADITISHPDITGSKTSLSFLVTPKDTADVISGVDLYVEVSNGEISSWEGCTNVQGTTPAFTELVTKTGKDARYSCVVLKEAKELPKSVVIKGQVTCATDKLMHIKILKDKTDVVGPVVGTEYALDTVAEFDYNCGGGTTPPLPSPPVLTGDITTSFSPDSCSTEVGGKCDFKLTASARNGKDRISGMYFKLTYDPNILKAVGVDKHTSSGQDGPPIKIEPPVVLGLIAQAAVTPPPSSTVPAVNTCQSNADCASGGTCVKPAGSTTGKCVYSNTTIPTTIPVTGAVTPAPTAIVSPTTIPVPSTTTVIPTISTSGTPLPPVPDICWMETVDYKPGELSFIYTCKQSAAQLPTSISLPIRFNAIGNGDGDLKVKAVQIAGPDVVGPYSVDHTSATYSIGGGTAGNLQLNMKLRMQCVLHKPRGPQTMKVKIGLGDGRLKAPLYQTAEFTADDKGFWNGTVTFKAPAGGGYKILPKGEKHMQKKICVNNPKEDYPGAYGCDKGGITLKDGENTIDFSSIVMLSGDLPPGEQDGISNAKDQSLVRNLIGKSDAESARLADINYDGVVNAVDHSCLIAALSVRWDEE